MSDAVYFFALELMSTCQHTEHPTSAAPSAHLPHDAMLEQAMSHKCSSDQRTALKWRHCRWLAWLSHTPQPMIVTFILT